MAEPIPDITPEHHPVAMLRDCISIAENSIAGVVILLDEDDRMHYQNCGVAKRDLVWALERMKAQIMKDDIDA